MKLWIAQGFGVGRIPMAPGTFGSVAGVLWFGLLLGTANLWLFAAGWKQCSARRGLAGAAMLALAAVSAAALPAVRNGLMFGRWSSGSGGWTAIYLGITPDAPGTFFYTDRNLAAAKRVSAAEDQSAALAAMSRRASDSSRAGFPSVP